jgi:hypothetical protein
LSLTDQSKVRVDQDFIGIKMKMGMLAEKKEVGHQEIALSLDGCKSPVSRKTAVTLDLGYLDYLRGSHFRLCLSLNK